MCLNRLELKHDTLRRLDPRARLAAALLLILAAVRLSNYIALVCIIAVCILLVCRDFICVIQRLIPVAAFCALLLVQAVCTLIPVQTAIIFILRILSAALLCMVLAVPLGMGTIAAALASFRLNPKLISIIYLTYRYIYMMHDTVMCSIKAMQLRKCPGQGLTFEWKCYATVFASALVGAFEKADTVSAALYKRGFDGIIPRTAVWRWRVYDTVFVGCCAAGLASSMLI